MGDGGWGMGDGGWRRMNVKSNNSGREGGRIRYLAVINSNGCVL